MQQIDIVEQVCSNLISLTVNHEVNIHPHDIRLSPAANETSHPKEVSKCEFLFHIIDKIGKPEQPEQPDEPEYLGQLEASGRDPKRLLRYALLPTRIGVSDIAGLALSHQRQGRLRQTPGAIAAHAKSEITRVKEWASGPVSTNSGYL